MAVRVLRRLGENPRLVEAALDAARAYSSGRPHEILLYFMGGLSNAAFFSHMVQALEDKQLAAMHSLAIDALGRIGDKKSLAALQNLLTGFCGVRVIDPPARRRITNCLSALGRIARHPDTSAERRNAVVSRVFR